MYGEIKRFIRAFLFHDTVDTIEVTKDITFDKDVTIKGTLTSSGATGLGNDEALILGTTHTTPATYKEIVYDATTTALGLSTNGISATPQIVKSTATGLVKVDETATSLPAAASSVTDLISDYRKILVTGAGVAAATPVVRADRLYIGTDGNNAAVSEAYVLQPWLTKNGTATVEQLALMSGVLDLGANAFTTNSGINGIDLVLQGASTITGTVKGISIDIKTGRVVDSGITINCQTTTKRAIDIIGSPIEGIKFNGTGPSISCGAASSDADIKTAQGKTAPAGSIWISSADGKVWVMVSTTWTNLTIN